MIHTQIREQIKDAMKAHDEVKLLVLRGLLSAFTNELINLKRKPSDELTDPEAQAVIKRAVKQRKDSIEQFRAGNREDLATSEEKELLILEPMLPKSASRDEIKIIAVKKIAELGITDTSKVGQLMGAIIKEFKGNADGNDVKAVVEELIK